MGLQAHIRLISQSIESGILAGILRTSGGMKKVFIPSDDRVEINTEI